MRCILVGNYGVGNWGDEALRERFLERFPDIDWTVVTADPGAPGTCARLPCGLRSFVALRWVHTLRLLRSVDAMILGGGTLFTDIESPKACVLWWLHVIAAWCMGVPVLAAAQGIGPFRTAVGRALACHALRKVVFLSVRDAESADSARACSLSKEIVLSFDPVLLSIASQSELRAKNILIIIPRANSTDSFRETALAEVRAWQGGVRVVLFDHGDPRECSWAMEFLLDAGRHIDVLPGIDTAGVGRACVDAGRIVTQRYHGAIVALALGIPYVRVPQGPGDKLARLPESADADSVRALRERVKRGEEALAAAFAMLPATRARRR